MPINQDDDEPFGKDVRLDRLCRDNTQLGKKFPFTAYLIPEGRDPETDAMYARLGTGAEIYLMTGIEGAQLIPELDTRNGGDPEANGALKEAGPDSILVIFDRAPPYLPKGATVRPDFEAYRRDSSTMGHTFPHVARAISAQLKAHGEGLGSDHDGRLTATIIGYVADSGIEWTKQQTSMEERAYDSGDFRFSRVPGSYCSWGKVTVGQTIKKFDEEIIMHNLINMSDPPLSPTVARELYDLAFKAGRTDAEVDKFCRDNKIPYNEYTCDILGEAWLGNRQGIPYYDYELHIKRWELPPAEILQRMADFREQKARSPSPSPLLPLEQFQNYGEWPTGGQFESVHGAYTSYRKYQVYLCWLATIGLRQYWKGDPMVRLWMRIDIGDGRVFWILGPLPRVPFGPLAFELRGPDEERPNDVGIQGFPFVNGQPHPRLQLATGAGCDNHPSPRPRAGHPCWVYATMGQLWEHCGEEVRRVLGGPHARRTPGATVSVQPEPPQMMPPSWQVFPAGSGKHKAYGGLGRPWEPLPLEGVSKTPLFWDVRVPMKGPGDGELGPA